MIATMAKRKPGTGRPRQDTTKRDAFCNVNIWIPPDVHAALLEACKLDRRSKTTQIEVILEENLRQRGLLKPHAPKSSQDEATA